MPSLPTDNRAQGAEEHAGASGTGLKDAPPVAAALRGMRRLGRSMAAVPEAMNRRPRLWLAIFSLWTAAQISPWWYPTDDGALYLSMARSIAKGESVAAFGRVNPGVPPGYALAISPVLLLRDRPFLELSVVQWLISIALIFGTYRWMRRRAPEAAVLLTGFVIVNAAVCYYHRRALKETLFLATLVWAADMLDGLWRARGRRELLMRLFPTATLLVLLLMVRYGGGVLFAGFGIAVLLRTWRREVDRRRAATLSLTLGAVIAATMCGLLVFLNAQAYLSGFSLKTENSARGLAEGIHLRVTDIGRITVAGMFKCYSLASDWWDPNLLIYLPTVVILGLGWRRLYKDHNALALTFPVYLGLYVAWPHDQATRYMVPMVPVLIAAAWLGFERLARWRPILFTMFFIAHFAASLGYWVGTDAPRVVAAHSHWHTIDSLTSHVDAEHEEVTVWRVPSSMQVMLKLALDRMLVPADPLQAPAASTPWLIQPQDAPPPAGFETHTASGGYVLLRKLSTPLPSLLSGTTPAVTAEAPSGSERSLH